MNRDDLLVAALTGGATGAPVVKTVAGTDPAANTECSDTVPTGKTWRLLAYSVQLAQGATQTPLPSLTITDGTTTLCSFPGASAAVSASTTSQMTWAPSQVLTAGAALTFNTAPIPFGLLLPAGYKLVTSTSGKGANTNYGAPTIWIVEYS